MDNQTENIIKANIVATIAIGIMYASFSFGLWELNPKFWSGFARFFFALMSAVIFGILNISQSEIIHNKK